MIDDFRLTAEAGDHTPCMTGDPISSQPPDSHQNPARDTLPRFHPGWIMLALAAATVFMSAPGQSFSVAAFVDPMLQELGIGRTQYTFAYMTATLIGGFSLPFIGRQVDRYGARCVLPLVAAGLALACGWMSVVSSLAGLYLGFTLIRCLGQGSLTLISNWIIGEWFQSRRGLAAGICAVGGTASVLIVPQINDAFIEAQGWRQAWLMLGGIVAGSLILPAVVFLRDRPEAMGLFPDWKFVRPSERPESTAASVSVSAADQDFTVRQALRCGSFWKIAAVVATVSLVGTGLMFHQVSLLAERGVDRRTALAALGVQAIAATLSTVIAGILTDRLPARFVLATSMGLEICAVSLLLVLPSSGWIFVYSALLGLHGGIIRSAGSIIWINYFGRTHQGAIQGVAMSVMVFAAALGPIPPALAHDLTGRYYAALVLFLAFPACAGLAVLSAHPPNRLPQAVSDKS